MAGGSAADPTKPGSVGHLAGDGDRRQRQGSDLRREAGSEPGIANCDGVTPGRRDDPRHVPPIGGFCWQQTGVERIGGTAADPTLNVDPTRDGVEPDIAFTGPSDAVRGSSGTRPEHRQRGGLHNNELVFAAKGVGRRRAGRRWLPMDGGRQPGAAGLLDTGTNHFGACAARPTSEAACSLNSNPAADAEDPRVAAGTMNPANPTVPWVAGTRRSAALSRSSSRASSAAARPPTSSWPTAARRSRPEPATRLARTSRSRATRPT